MSQKNTVERSVLENIIFGPTYSRRFTQDTPLLPDVWLAYARDPSGPLGLILEPERNRRSGEAALAIRDRLQLFREHCPHLPKADGSSKPRKRKSADIAHLPGIIVLRVYFDELINVVLPFTTWWRTNRDRFFEALDFEKGAARGEVSDQDRDALRARRKKKLVRSFEYLNMPERDKEHFYSTNAKAADPNQAQISIDVVRLAYAAGMIYLHNTSSAKELAAMGEDLMQSCADSFLDLLQTFEVNIEKTSLIGSVFRISRNRDAQASVDRSSVACKADAARLLFNVSCKKITWAVADSGISHRHPAFHSWREGACGSRVIETYDFTRLRSVLSLDRSRAERAKDMFEILLKGKGAGLTSEQEAEDEKDFGNKLRQHIDELLNRIDKGFDVDWALLEPFIRLDQKDLETLPISDHGTHVAGIIGADWPDPYPEPANAMRRASDREELPCMHRLNEQELHQGRRGDESDSVTDEEGCDTDEISLGVNISDRQHKRISDEATRRMTGMCPDIRLIDLRVLRGDHGRAENARSDEFEVMAAMQFVRHLNSKAGHMRVHGVNLSLSIEHDLANYACGRTPVCMECEELVSSGVVVVAAAGNKGYRSSGYTNVNDQGNYQSVSISDPGNAEKVITVGATHRYRPHDYGVSYFSSRGPTGDGRRKPDLVAPGEKINGPVRLVEDATKDGTSMAAPHVSGAAAMLMARHPELIGKPEKIKQILCSTATDLQREHYFQGHGMLDVLRALQSV